MGLDISINHKSTKMTKTFNAKKFAVWCVVIITFLGAGLHSNIIKLPITNVTSSMWIGDLETYEGTVKVTSNIFVGKVIKQAGSQADDIVPETQFEVEVIDNIKGNLQGNIVVSQEGGYKNGVLYRSSDDITATADKPTQGKDDGLMKEGETYLFVTIFDEIGKWYDVIPHSNGTKLLSKDKNLDKAAMKDLYEKDERYIKLKEAYEKGKSTDASVKKDNTENSDRLLQKIEE